MKRLVRIAATLIALPLPFAVIAQAAPAPAALPGSKAIAPFPAPAQRSHAADPQKTTLPFTLSKETTRITSPLLPDGSPDYIGALNERLSQGVTAENNGFVLLLQATGTGPAFLSPEIQEKVLELYGATIKSMPADAQAWHYDNDVETDRFYNLRYELWSAEAHPRDAELLKSNGKSLDIACRAAGRPNWWCPYIGTSMMRVDSQPLGVLREFCSLLVNRATLRVKAGDFDGFLADVLATKRLARHLANGSIPVEAVVGYGIDRLANDAIGTAVGSGTLSAAQCTQLQTTLAAVPGFPKFTDTVDIGNRYELLNTIVVLATRNGLDRKEFAFMNDLSIDRANIDWDAVLKMANRTIDDEIASLNSPTLKGLQESDAAMERERRAFRKEDQESDTPVFAKRAGESKEIYTQRAGRMIILAILNSMESGEEIRRRCVLQDELLQILLVAAKAKANTGKWPEKLEDLVPRELKQVPIDPYSLNGALNVQYSVTDGHALVYSLGKNGLDNSGKGDDIPAGFNPHPPAP